MVVFFVQIAPDRLCKPVLPPEKRAIQNIPENVLYKRNFAVKSTTKVQWLYLDLEKNTEYIGVKLRSRV